jgi:hypothetical protein
MSNIPPSKDDLLTTLGLAPLEPAPDPESDPLGARILELSEQGYTEEQIRNECMPDLLALEAECPPIGEFRERRTREICQFLNREILMLCHEMAIAHTKGNSRKVDAIIREIVQRDDYRELALQYLRSDEFTSDVRAEWAAICREAADACRAGRTAADASAPEACYPPTDLPEQAHAAFVRYFVMKEIEASLEKIRQRGGRPREWDDMWKVIQENRDKSDEQIAALYKQRYSRRPKNHLAKVNAKKVREVRANYSRREQNHD